MTKCLPVLALLAALSPGATLAGESAGYNGTWAVELVTESGLCSARYSYAVAIREGQVRLASAGSGARMSGRVGADGSVGLSVSNASATGSASGRLQARTGGGTWTVGGLCSGRWTARRSDTRTAEAS